MNSEPAAVAGATALGPPCAAMAACAAADRLYPPYAKAANRRSTIAADQGSCPPTHTPWFFGLRIAEPILTDPRSDRRQGLSSVCLYPRGSRLISTF